MEQAQALADGFVCCVAGNPGEGAIHPQNDATGVGDDHAFLRLENDGGNPELLLRQLAFAGVANDRRDETALDGFPHGKR